MYMTEMQYFIIVLLILRIVVYIIYKVKLKYRLVRSIGSLYSKKNCNGNGEGVNVKKLDI